ncbi:MAG: FtsX-like permease family protein [Lachnospiraceae bacterium]|nr:FtsX-like permease family protein [Lachnospiraceae bacterium]
MSILKRAILYVSRKWQQSLIIFLVLLVVCTSTLIGFAVLKASDSAAANLRKQLGGTFSMEINMSNSANMQGAVSTDQYTGSYYVGKYLDQTVIDEVMKTSGISEYSANTEVVANLKSTDGAYYNLIENFQNYYSSSNSHIASIQGWTSLHQCAYFANKILEVTQGEMFTTDASSQAVISRELAELNHIEIGDKLILEINREVTGIDFPVEKQECVFDIVGIFDILGEQQIDQYTSQRQMLQNWVFVDSRTLLPYLNELLVSIGEQPIGYEKVTFSVNDPAEMDSIIKNIQQNKAINWSYFKIKIDNTNYQNAENALKSMDKVIRIMILAITISGIGILILLLSIWARSRIYETGILLSAGKSKWEILAQRITEIVLITILAFGISYTMSNITANDVGNLLLSQANEQNSDESKTNAINTEMPISTNNFDLTPVFSAPKVEELTVNVSADVFAVVYAVELLIVLLSVCVAGISVMKMKPKAILTKMS